MYVRVKLLKVSAVKSKYYIKNIATAGVGVLTDFTKRLPYPLRKNTLYLFYEPHIWSGHS